MRGCGKHPEHHLDTTLRLRDLGKSAFHGANLDKDKGDLGKFLWLVQQGKVERDSILCIENLDRFSREDAHTAYSVFGDLVKAGVVVQTLSPERTIDRTNFNDMGVVIETILTMVLSHEESEKKSQRIAAVWKARRQRATEDGTPMSKRCPCWLYWDDKAGKWRVKPDGRKIVAYIFKRTTEGIGQKRLLGELQEKFKPLGKSQWWRGSMVSDILTSRAVLGEATPCRRSDKPQPPIVGYYPPVIPDGLWYRARAVIDARKQAKGRNGQFVNLFVGLLRMPDGHPAHIQTITSGKPVRRRLVSAGHRDKVKGSCGLSVDYWKAEKYLLAMLYQIKPTDLFPKTAKSYNGIKDKERELVGVELRIAEIDKAATAADSKTSVADLLKWKTEATTKADGIKQEIETLRQHEATTASKPLENFKDILTTLEKRPEAEQHDLRLKLRGLIADIVERVELVPYRNGRQRVEAELAVYWKDPALPNLSVDTGTMTIDDLAVLSHLMTMLEPYAKTRKGKRHTGTMRHLPRIDQDTLWRFTYKDGVWRASPDSERMTGMAAFFYPDSRGGAELKAGLILPSEDGNKRHRRKASKTG